MIPAVALVGLERLELVALDLAVFHPLQRLVHAEAQDPSRHGEQEAAAFARAPTMVAAAAAGFDVDEHHIASAGARRRLEVVHLIGRQHQQRHVAEVGA